MTETKSDASASLKAKKHISQLNASLTQRERSERARNAGLASGAARRKKRLMRDVLSDILSTELPVEQAEIRCQLQELGLNTDAQTAMCYSILCRAIRGDVEAARWIRDTSGNKLAENLNVGRTEEIPFQQLDLSSLSNEELMRMLNDVQQDERLIGESANNIRKNED